MMKFHYTNLETCRTATGLVVVIDVIRAFTSAAFAFAGGVEKIYPVGMLEEALEFKQKNPGTLACGEVGGIPPEGFDFGNSPMHILKMNLKGRVLVQRTSAGTQGIVRSTNAGQIIAASFVVAKATVRYVQELAPETITFVVTGQTYNGGEEDLACAEYIEELLRGNSPDPAPFLERVKSSEDAKMFYDSDFPQLPEADVAHFISLDKFDFAMPIMREDGRLVMHCVRT